MRVGRDILKLLDLAAGPADREPVDTRRRAKAEVAFIKFARFRYARNQLTRLGERVISGWSAQALAIWSKATLAPALPCVPRRFKSLPPETSLLGTTPTALEKAAAL